MRDNNSIQAAFKYAKIPSGWMDLADFSDHNLEKERRDHKNLPPGPSKGMAFYGSIMQVKATTAKNLKMQFGEDPYFRSL